MRIVLADDHVVVRSGLRMLLEDEPDLEVVAEAGDIESARRRFDRVRALVKESRLTGDFMNEIKESIRQIEIAGLKKLADQLLEKASDLARKDDVAGRAAAIKEAREHITRCLALGAEPDFKEVSEKKIEIALMTSSRVVVLGQPEQEPGFFERHPQARRNGSDTDRPRAEPAGGTVAGRAPGRGLRRTGGH